MRTPITSDSVTMALALLKDRSTVGETGIRIRYLGRVGSNEPDSQAKELPGALFTLTWERESLDN